MKKVIVLALFAIMSLSAFAQDVETSTTADLIWAFIVDNWIGGIGLSLILSTLLSRFIPTEKANIYIDVIGWLIKLIPNRKKGGGAH